MAFCLFSQIDSIAGADIAVFGLSEWHVKTTEGLFLTLFKGISHPNQIFMATAISMLLKLEGGAMQFSNV